jgi:glycerol-3-phosphate acyltransferase PlsY
LPRLRRGESLEGATESLNHESGFWAFKTLAGSGSTNVDAFLALVLGYIVGSLPLGYLIASRLRGIDLRRVGSGNVGATNVYRSAGLSTALLVIVVDIAKGAGSVTLAARMLAGPSAPVAAGVAAIIGHVYPVWLRFRGGKGVATACGAFSILAPLATAFAGAMFVITVWATRYVSGRWWPPSRCRRWRG